MKEFFRALRPIMKKEFLHVRRDSRTLAILFFVPAGLILFIGFVVNFDVSHIKLAVLDQDQTIQSRDMIESFTHTEYFDYTYSVHSQQDVDRLLDDGKIDAAIVIPSRFADFLVKGQTAHVQVLVDGSNSTTASSVVGYLQAAIGNYSSQLQADDFTRMGKTMYTPVDFRPRAWYNPELSTVKYLIPGLIGYILMIVNVVTTALAVVREKEKGTMEQIVVSPVTTLELILGKLIPYLVIAMFATIVLLVAAFLVFGIAIKGSLFALFLCILVFLVCALGLGLWVSTVSNSSQVAFTIAILVSTLPSMMLSGFMFPIRSMPVPVQILTNITPAKFFINTLRAIMLKGVGFDVYWRDLGAMLIFATIIIGLSARRLSRQKL